jgi:PKHD-type hydroxylase
MVIAPLEVPDAFSAEECARAVAALDGLPLEPATVWSGSEDQVDARVRQAMRRYWPRGERTAWIYERLDLLFARAARHFDTAVDPLFEDIQFLRYEVGDHFQSWHSDAGLDRAEQRRLSVSVELSEPGDHEGGVLEIAPVVGGARTLPRGGARLFPSRAIHRVTPVTRGVRLALVGWTGRRE